MNDPQRLLTVSPSDEVDALELELLRSLQPSARDKDALLGRVLAQAGAFAGVAAATAAVVNQAVPSGATVAALPTAATASHAGSVAGTVTASAGTTNATSPALASALLGGATKTGLALLVAAPLVFGGAYLLGGSPQQASLEAKKSPKVSAQQTSLVAQTAPADLAPVEPQSETGLAQQSDRAPQKTAQQVATPVKQAPPSHSSLAEETRMLRAARDLAKGHKYKEALRALRSLDEQIPRGALLQEREALRISVLQSLGSEAQAASRHDAFVEKYPDSPFAAPASEAERQKSDSGK